MSTVNLSELKQLMEMLSIERGLDSEEIIKAMEQAIASAYRKEFGQKEKSYEADFDLNKGTYSLYEVTLIVEEVENPEREINLIQAKLYNPEARLGEKIRKEIYKNKEIEFGRIASQIARQVMFQSVSSIRHSKILAKFKDKIGDIVNVEIDFFKRGGYLVKIGQTSGFISREDLLPIDKFKPGQVVKALIVDITEDARGNSRILLSRSHPDFVKAIIANEVPEVQAGIVTIDKIVREPGSRSKILVSTSDEESIDPVGAILGKKNIRINNIMKEISSTMMEKIDVIENNPGDLELMIMDALEPAEIESVELDRENRVAKVYCYPEEAAPAVGKYGINIRLAGELLDFDLHIKTIDEEDSKNLQSVNHNDDD